MSLPEGAKRRLNLYDGRGFLLLEVILSVLLVSGGLLVVVMSFSISKNLLLRSREIFHSGLLLREKMFDWEEKGEVEDRKSVV